MKDVQLQQLILLSFYSSKMYRNPSQIRKLITSNQLRRYFSSNVEPSENAPIKFSTSQAAKKHVIPIVKYTDKRNMPWYQPYIVVSSIAVFLMYFCILREENDVDQEFNKTLYERIRGLEKTQLVLSYKHNKETGKSVEDIEKRLKELEEEEAKLTEQLE